MSASRIKYYVEISSSKDLHRAEAIAPLLFAHYPDIFDPDMMEPTEVWLAWSYDLGEVEMFRSSDYGAAWVHGDLFPYQGKWLDLPSGEEILKTREYNFNRTGDIVDDEGNILRYYDAVDVEDEDVESS